MRFAIVREMEVDGGKRSCAPRRMEIGTGAPTGTSLLLRRHAVAEPEHAAKGREGDGSRSSGMIRC